MGIFLLGKASRLEQIKQHITNRNVMKQAHMVRPNKNAVLFMLLTSVGCIVL